VRLQTLRHAVGVLLRLQLVVLERIEDPRVVRRRNHLVQHAQHVLLERMRLVDVFDQLLLQLRHSVQPPQGELTEFTAEQGGPAEVAAVPGLETVDEHSERPAVVQLEASHLERQAWKVRKFGCPAPAVDPLETAVQRRQRARDALHGPDTV
jgi:hypothetical protein